MAHRGAYGIRIDGEDKMLNANHNSYPSSLGASFAADPRPPHH